MDIANLIDDEERRSNARKQAAHRIGLCRGTYLWHEYYIKKGYGLEKGYPADWTAEELRSFGIGAMQNHTEDYEIILQNAETEEQRQSLHYGLIGGASASDPATAAPSVSALEPTLLENNSELKKTLRPTFSVGRRLIQLQQENGLSSNRTMKKPESWRMLSARS